MSDQELRELWRAYEASWELPQDGKWRCKLGDQELARRYLAQLDRSQDKLLPIRLRDWNDARARYLENQFNWFALSSGTIYAPHIPFQVTPLMLAELQRLSVTDERVQDQGDGTYLVRCTVDVRVDSGPQGPQDEGQGRIRIYAGQPSTSGNGGRIVVTAGSTNSNKRGVPTNAVGSGREET